MVLFSVRYNCKLYNRYNCKLSNQRARFVPRDQSIYHSITLHCMIFELEYQDRISSSNIKLEYHARISRSNIKLEYHARISSLNITLEYQARISRSNIKLEYHARISSSNITLESPAHEYHAKNRSCPHNGREFGRIFACFVSVFKIVSV